MTRRITVRSGSIPRKVAPPASDAGALALVLPVKTDTGDPSSPVEGQTYVNTADKKVRVYADAAWRDLATW